MKTSKPTSQASTQEECGVWLDTVQLKGRAKQKRFTCPISKVLNPFAGGYNLAVALNFTQTKMKMPITKQSSISSYFAPQHRSLNKMSTSEARNTDQINSPSSSSTSTQCVSTSPLAFGTKRKRGMDCELSNLNNTMECHAYTPHSDVDREGLGPEKKSKSMTNYKHAVCQEDYGEGYPPSVNMDHESKEEAEEMNEPERKQKVTKTSSPPVESVPAVEWCSQETWNTCSSPHNTQELMVPNEMIRCNYINHDSESQFNLTHQEKSTTRQGSEDGMTVLESMHNEEGFRVWLDMKGRNSAQKYLKCLQSSQKEKEKKNTRSPLHKSPKKCSSFSPLRAFSSHKWTEPKNMPSHKNILEKPERGSLASQHKWPTPRCSSLKKGQLQQPWREVEEEESLSSLFTQDSEGFRVIAHHGLTARSPLKDHTNVSFGSGKKMFAYKSLLEEEDEMLFTQDSQGNMVIKH
ncbi:uncharacterized protein LOC130128415 [Lampris incognitus]|uniref:uncharacterized protein LOC130128415 n=1 Tax=Lampris incognitus TaxID=2546036 RepID=UPI0024B4C9B3|nr:uncharacterized protein LOC130128415 [Lampris incognitus]